MKAPTGAAMQLDVTPVRFAKGARPGPKETFGVEQIPELRKLLRTDKSIAEIAEHFGVTSPTLRYFIKRRSICDLKARRDFNSLQRSLAREERLHSSDGEQPHCRRTRADSSPAAGTNPNSSAILPDEWRRPSLPTPGEPPVTAGVYNFRSAS